MDIMPPPQEGEVSDHAQVSHSVFVLNGGQESENSVTPELVRFPDILINV